MIGVSNIEISIEFYRSILGYDEIVYDIEGRSSDLEDSLSAPFRLRRVLLGRSTPPAGAFGPLLGTSRIELVQAIDRVPSRIFANRFWGDLGFIHVCFDVRGIELTAEGGTPFSDVLCGQPAYAPLIVVSRAFSSPSMRASSPSAC